MTCAKVLNTVRSLAHCELHNRLPPSTKFFATKKLALPEQKPPSSLSQHRNIQHQYLDHIELIISRTTKASNESTSDRQITIKLELTPNGLPQFDMLDRWLVRCGHATKKGTNIKMSYTVYGTHVFLVCPYTQHYDHQHRQSYSTAIGMQIAGTLGLPPHVGTPVGDVYVAQKAALRRMEKAGMGKGRVCQELRKIVNALRAPQPLR
ncbi:hypothetical protein LTR17_004387 [Elasticomyces elasticus]|nr:hypothetical protein LTR17_004387 [Elasticomyces elasticus]